MYVAAHNGSHVWGGAERATALLLAGLRGRGHRVRLYCNDRVVRDRAEALGVPASLRPLRGDLAVHDAFALARALRRERPDLLLAGSFRKLWLAALAAKLARVPRVVARVGLETDTPRNPKYRLVLRHWVDAVVVNADRMRPPFLALPGWSEERVFTIYNGVRPPRTLGEPGALRAALGLDAGAVLVGAVARLAKQKRLDRLVRAVAALPDFVHGVLAGEGVLHDSLRDLVRELGVDARVHFLGHRDDVGDVLSALDLFVVCSDREGMSNAMLEAMAAGVPVVSTPVSGAREALDAPAGETPPGVIVGFSEEALTDALRVLAADPELRRRMGAAAERRARERFGMDEMLDAWEAALARVLHGPEGRP